MCSKTLEKYIVYIYIYRYIDMNERDLKTLEE